MDDTPARMNPGGQDRSDRRPDDMTGRQQESMRGYGGEAVSPSTTSGAAASPPFTPARGREGSREEAEEPDTRQIRADIERTREDMAETIDAIQEKLRPGNLMAEARDRVRDSATSKMRSLADSAGEGAQAMMHRTRGTTGSFTERAGQNPIPMALIGLGAAWLLWNQRRTGDRPHHRVDRDWPGRYREAVGYEEFDDRADLSDDPYVAYEYGRDTARFDQGRWRTYGESGWTSGLMRRISDHPVPAALTCAGIAWLAFSDGEDRDDRLYTDTWWPEDRYRSTTAESGGEQSTMGRAKETLSSVASRAPEATREMADRAGRFARGATRRFRGGARGRSNGIQQLMRRNPLLAGAGAFVLGTAVGLLLPETERENELMGETRDRMLERAQEKARGVASGAKEAAGEAVGRLATDVAGGGEGRGSTAGRSNT